MTDYGLPLYRPFTLDAHTKVKQNRILNTLDHFTPYQHNDPDVPPFLF